MADQGKGLLQGTLQLLILKTLSLGPLHGLGITRRLEQTTRGDFRVSLGSLFPSLHRMEQEGWIVAQWGRSENNRKARFYRLTPAGRKQLTAERKHWDRVTTAVSRVLEAT
jgi:PadR family transcriptional regulator PadR